MRSGPRTTSNDKVNFDELAGIELTDSLLWTRSSSISREDLIIDVRIEAGEVERAILLGDERSDVESAGVFNLHDRTSQHFSIGREDSTGDGALCAGCGVRQEKHAKHDGEPEPDSVACTFHPSSCSLPSTRLQIPERH